MQGEQPGHELQEAGLIPRAGVNTDKFLKHRLRTGVQLDRALEHSPSARIIADQAQLADEQEGIAGGKTLLTDKRFQAEPGLDRIAVRESRHGIQPHKERHRLIGGAVGGGNGRRAQLQRVVKTPRSQRKLNLGLGKFSNDTPRFRSS